MTQVSNIVSVQTNPKGDIFGALKGDGFGRPEPRVVAGLDAMLGKRADITSRVVAA